MYKRLVSLDDECETILKQLPEKKASNFVREAVKLKARTLQGDVKEAPKPIPTVRIRI